MSGPASFSVVDDVIGLVIFGLLGIVLLNLSAWINDTVVFSKFDNEREIVEDRNAGMGAVEGGQLHRGRPDHGGGDVGRRRVAPGLVFWVLGLAALVIAGLLYDRITSYDLHDQIEQDNVAVGSGVCRGSGRFRQHHPTGRRRRFRLVDGESDRVRVLHHRRVDPLPLVRLVADKVLLPGANLSSELVKDRPNLGAGVIEAGHLSRGVDADRLDVVTAQVPGPHAVRMRVWGRGPAATRRMTTPTTARQGRLDLSQALALKACIFATGLAGIVAEYVMATLASYLLGNAVLQWTLTVSLMLFADGCREPAQPGRARVGPRCVRHRGTGVVRRLRDERHAGLFSVRLDDEPGTNHLRHLLHHRSADRHRDPARDPAQPGVRRASGKYQLGARIRLLRGLAGRCAVCFRGVAVVGADLHADRAGRRQPRRGRGAVRASSPGVRVASRPERVVCRGGAVPDRAGLAGRADRAVRASNASIATR